MRGNTIQRQLIVTVSCAVVFAALLIPFRYFQDFNYFALIRPTDGLGPALGFVLGMPAIIGCALAWLAVQLAFGAEPEWLIVGFVYQIIYLALPRLIWCLFVVLKRQIRSRSLRKSKHNAQDDSGISVENSRSLSLTPRLNTTGKIALYLAAALLSAFFAGMFITTVDNTLMPNCQMAHEYEFFHSFVFLVYLGLPIVLATSRRIGARTGERSGALGEVIVILFLTIIAVIAVVFFAITYLVYIIDGTFTTLEEYMTLVNTFYVVVTELTLAGFVIMLFAVYAISRRATRPIEALTNSTALFAEQLERRSLTGEEIEVKSIDERGMSPALEVRELISAVGSMQSDLVTYIERFEEATAKQERVEAELDISHDIQASAVPRNFSSQLALGLEIEGFMRPAREVGGDFYDVFDLDETRTAMVIGDVSGKGVPAALFMMRALSVIRSCIISENDLQSAFSAANKLLEEGNDATLFVTAFACVLDRSTATLHYVNAGHNPPSLRCGGQRRFLKTEPGFVLGVISNTSYSTASVPFMPGDELVLYTDGVTEAANSDAAMFGTGRLESVLARWDGENANVDVNSDASNDANGKNATNDIGSDDTNNDGEPESLASILVDSIDRFAGEALQADDITILRMLWGLKVSQIEVESVDSALDTINDWLERAVEELSDAAQTDASQPNPTQPDPTNQTNANQSNATQTTAESLDNHWQKRLLFRLKLIAEELLVNVSHHGRSGPEKAPVPVRFRIAYDASLDVVHLGMEDEGIAYNLLEHETRPPTLDGPVGGMGIHLVRELSDHASYERVGVYNVHHLSIRVRRVFPV